MCDYFELQHFFNDLCFSLFFYRCLVRFYCGFVVKTRYHVYIDENGDAAGNYTILALKNRIAHQDGNLSMAYGLYPIGTFRPTFSQPDSNQIPVS